MLHNFLRCWKFTEIFVLETNFMGKKNLGADSVNLKFRGIYVKGFLFLISLFQKNIINFLFSMKLSNINSIYFLMLYSKSLVRVANYENLAKYTL